jgi:hypothetical protein
MRSRKSSPLYDALRDANRLSSSFEDISIGAWNASMETAILSTTSLAAFVRTRGLQTRAVEERRKAPLTRHYLFNGRGGSEAVLSYYDPRDEESQAEEAIVA